MLELTLGADSYSITDVADLIENVVTEISRTTDEEIAFLVNHWPEIEIAFSEHARPETLTRLDRLGRQRLRRMFPGGIVD